MKNKPIKRHPALISLSRDHHYGLLLVWKIRQGIKTKVDVKRIGNYAIFFFERELQPHFEKEEKELFTRLPDGDLLRQQAFKEHDQIRNLVNRLQADKENTDVLKELADTLESHIRFEERVLFNHLQDTLSEDELLKVAHEHGENKRNFDSEWSDHFWTN